MTSQQDLLSITSNGKARFARIYQWTSHTHYDSTIPDRIRGFVLTSISPDFRVCIYNDRTHLNTMLIPNDELYNHVMQNVCDEMAIQHVREFVALKHDLHTFKDRNTVFQKLKERSCMWSLDGNEIPVLSIQTCFVINRVFYINSYLNRVFFYANWGKPSWVHFLRNYFRWHWQRKIFW